MAARPSLPTPPAMLRLVAAPPAPPSREPEWVARAWEATRREVVSYYRTTMAFGLRPRRTAALWVDGKIDALNPLAYILNTVAIFGPWRALWQLILHTPDTPLWMDVLFAVSPFLTLLASAGTNHLLFRLFGSKRHFTSTVAISIYATGGLPPMLLALAVTPVALLTVGLRAPEAILAHWPHYTITYASIALSALWTSRSFAGLHGMSWAKTLGIQALGACLMVLAALVVWAQMVAWLVLLGSRIHH